MTGHITPPHDIYVSTSIDRGGRYGRGVFAGKTILAGSLIETCPVIALFEESDRGRLRKTELVNYYFLWGDTRKRAALCLGYGSVYNHSFSPNARYEKMTDESRMDFYALKDIQKDEEITVNYNGTPSDTRSLRIPGIPADAGGPRPARLPRAVEGIIRRGGLVYAWLVRG